MGINTEAAESISLAKRALAARAFDLCLTDMNLPDGNGIELVEHIQASHPGVPVAMITAYGSVDTAIRALKAGAFDFVSKPIELERLRGLISTALKLTPATPTQTLQGDHQLLGSAPAIEQLRQQVLKLGRSQAPVFIQGESGSGKELVARLIHGNSPRGSKPFVAVNCGAIPTDLMESEFFGHRKGSFTGATEDKKGLFQAADGGTLFLDEVADLPLAMQVKLLRAIQEKAVRRIGDHEEIATDVRILSATHKDLAAEVNADRFRSDLFYRINVIELKVPPLRDRPEDIPLLANVVLKQLGEEAGVPTPKLSADALALLKTYAFPGNVRELENILERAFTLCEGEAISASDLRLSPGTVEPANGITANGSLYPKINIEEAFGSLEEFLESIEREVLTTALERARWNKTNAAKLLGISFRALRYRLKKLNLDD
jgi:two-component system response regulator PilR (NtrC family)